MAADRVERNARRIGRARDGGHQEEDVQALKPDRLHGEEVDREHLVGVLTNELAPRALTEA
jgi:hypothetical protein